MYKSCYNYYQPKFLGIPLRFPEDKFRRSSWLWQGLLIFIAVVLLVMLVIYLAFRPHKPDFSVQDAIINQLNITDDNALTSSLQFIVISHNPNDKIGVYYDRMSTYATYMTQQITPTISITPFYQGHQDTNTLAPFLNGTVFPLARSVAENLRADLNRGILSVNLRIGGKIQWEMWKWTSRYYHLNVNCFVSMPYKNNSVPLLLPEEGTRCDVSV